MSAYDNLYTAFCLMIPVNETGYWNYVANGMLYSLSGRREAVGIQRVYWSQALHESEPGVKTCHLAPGDRFHMSEHLFHKCFLEEGGLQEPCLLFLSTEENLAYRMWRFQY